MTSAYRRFWKGQQYETVARLGSGGMGEVFAVIDHKLGHKKKAIKTIRPDLLADSDVRRRFKIEIDALCRLTHPNIVEIIEQNLDHNPPFFVQELLTGRTLANLIEER